MAHIQIVQDHEATGLLKKMYAAAIERAGRVFGIVRLMSPNPPVMRASMMLYREVMFGDSPLSRSQRERLATVVSRKNDCFY
jgi:alkylhydroperoxidase family enzyme